MMTTKNKVNAIRILRSILKKETRNLVRYAIVRTIEMLADELQAVGISKNQTRGKHYRKAPTMNRPISPKNIEDNRAYLKTKELDALIDKINDELQRSYKPGAAYLLNTSVPFEHLDSIKKVFEEYWDVTAGPTGFRFAEKQ